MNDSFVLSADLAAIQMLQSAPMSEMRKLLCSAKQTQQRRLMAVRIYRVSHSIVRNPRDVGPLKWC